MEAVLLLVTAELVPTFDDVSQRTFGVGSPSLTSTADFMRVAESHPIVGMDRGDSRAERFYDAVDFVSERLSQLEVVLLCTTEAGVRCFNEDLVIDKGAGILAGYDCASRRTTKYFIGNR